MLCAAPGTGFGQVEDVPGNNFCQVDDALWCAWLWIWPGRECIVLCLVVALARWRMRCAVLGSGFGQVENALCCA